MIEDRTLRVVLYVAGMLYIAGVYPLMHQSETELTHVVFSLYVTLGVFLLLASRNPSGYRSLISFAAWSSLAHAAVMAVQASHDLSGHGHLLSGAGLLLAIGGTLIALSPEKNLATETQRT